MAVRFQGPADQSFIGMGVLVRAIGLRRVEQRVARIHGLGNQVSHLPFVGGSAVGVAHTHAAEADGGNFQVFS